jgi:heme-degrading monooxygenase HmoA
MLVRTWRGWTRATDADEYLEYINRTGLTAYQATPGNRGAAVWRRIADGRAEFVVVSQWDSLEAVRRFAGPDPERAVFYPEDARYLVAREEHVTHYEVVYTDAPLSGSAAAAPVARPVAR